MKWALLFIVGAGVLAAIVGYRFWSVESARDEVRAWCSNTHRGRTWSEMKDRAESKGLEIVAYGGNEQLVFEDAMDKRFGCIVAVDKDGYVLEARFSELLAK